VLRIADITKFTLQDYPNKIACIVWFAGCSMRCQYCYNTELLEKKYGFLRREEIFQFLETKIGLLDGVVLSGGECTLAEELGDFAVEIKKLGFLLKIDTNGLNLEMIVMLVENGLVDFIALDFKAPEDKFTEVTQLSKIFYRNFKETLKFTVESYLRGKIDMEIRTTVHTSLIGEGDINGIISEIDDLGYNGGFYIQNFRNDGKNTLANLGDQIRPLDREKIIKPKNFSLGYRNFF
jgi:pyruvate formate lyase activating enzyme